MDQIDPRERRITAFLHRIQEAPDFPAFSAQMREIMTGLANEAVPIQRLANIVLRDYSMSLKVLRAANSVQYNRTGRPVRSATHAMMLIGARAARDLASSILLFEHYREQSSRLKDLLLLSLLSANHAREAAVQTHYHEPEEAYVCGMFRNLGEVLVAAHAAEEYEAILQLAEEETISVAEAGLRILEFPFEELGVAMARFWGMPDSVRAGMRASGAVGESLLSQLAVLGHELTESIYGRAGEVEGGVEQVHARFGERLRLGHDEMRQVVEVAVRETRTIFADARVTLDDLHLARQARAALRELDGGVSPDPSAGPVLRSEEELLRRRLLQEVEAATSEVPVDLQRVVLMTLEAAFRCGSADRVVLCLFDARRGELQGRVGLGEGVEGLAERLRIPVSVEGGALGVALMRGRDIRLGGGRSRRREEAAWLEEMGIRGAALLVIRIGQEPIGALYLDRRHEPLALDAETWDYLGELRGILARAIAISRGAASGPCAAPPEADRERTAEDRVRAVLRILAGEAPAVICADLRIDVGTLDAWRAEFLAESLARLGGEGPARAAG